MQAQLLAQARIDAKTGLLNAGTWQREAAAEFYRARRSDAPLALVMVDIDHFNSVNETAGLAAGDQVLQGIARTVTQNMQGPGLVGRLAGSSSRSCSRRPGKPRPGGWQNDCAITSPGSRSPSRTETTRASSSG